MNRENTTGNALADKARVLLQEDEFPILVMQAEPRQVVTANKKACALFGKELAQIEGFRGGQVFDCIHSFTEAGCGKDENCEDCKIKGAVVDTFISGQPHEGVETVLEIKKREAISPYRMRLSTRKAGDFVLIAIDSFTRKQ